jgi:hypothetical protein
VSHVFFRPSDIRTVVCSVTNITKGGSGFAVAENEEQVFLNPQIVEQSGVDVGDFLTAYCIDNHRPEVDGDYSVRWRAIRVVVTEKFAPQTPETINAAAKQELTSEQIMEKSMQLLQRNRAWTSAQIAREIGSDSQRVSNVLTSAHDTGRIAAAKLYTNGTQDRCTAMFFARDVALLDELITEVVLED